MSSLSQRPATDADLDTIYSILREALGAYVEQVYGPWDDAEQRARFDASTHVADHSILDVDGEAIGFTCITKSAVDVYLVRLMIRPSFQNRGFGSQVLRDLIASADRDRLPVRLRVMKVNPARRLYERNGFVITEQSDTHYMMVRPATDR